MRSVPRDDPSPSRVAQRATWMVNRLHARSFGMLNAGFEAHDGGLRGYHYRLLAALDEGGPTSQADLAAGPGSTAATSPMR